MVITLTTPIDHDGGKITELKLREPTGAEMREAEKKLSDGVNAESNSAFEAALVGAVSGLKESALNLLPVSVMQKAREFVVGFDLGSGKPAEEQLPELELDLPEPLTIDGMHYASITLHEPTVGMRRRAETALRTGSTPSNRRQYQLLLIAAASGVPFATVEQFPVSVLNDADVYLMGFIQPGRRAGSN